MTLPRTLVFAATLALAVACSRSSASPDAVCKNMEKLGDADWSADDRANCKTLIEIAKNEIGDKRYNKMSSCILAAKDLESGQNCSDAAISEAEMETYIAKAKPRWQGRHPSASETVETCSSDADCGDAYACLDGICVDSLKAYSIKQRRLAVGFCGQITRPTTAVVECDDELIVDLEPLAKLTMLELLLLEGTKATDLRPLAGLTKLTELVLKGAPVLDLKPLAQLTNLQHLDLSFTPVSDLAPLAGLTKLETLNLEETKVADLGPLANLTQLKRLDLSNSLVSDIESIAKLTNLEELDLHYAFVPKAKVEALRIARPDLDIIF